MRIEKFYTQKERPCDSDVCVCADSQRCHVVSKRSNDAMRPILRRTRRVLLTMSRQVSCALSYDDCAHFATSYIFCSSYVAGAEARTNHRRRHVAVGTQFGGEYFTAGIAHALPEPVQCARFVERCVVLSSCLALSLTLLINCSGD